MTDLREIQVFYKSRDPLIYPYILSTDYSKLLDETGNPDYFISLCKIIVSQQLSGKAAETIYYRFQSLFNGNPQPQEIYEMSGDSLRNAGLSWSKVSYVKDLAEKALSNDVNFENLHLLQPGDVVKELTKIKGIGVWSVEMFLIFTLKNEDVFSLGDLGLKKAVCNIYSLDNPEGDSISEIVNKWSPYRSYGSMALWNSLDNR